MLAPVGRAAASTGTRSRADPFAVSLEDKIELCLRAEEALRTRT